MSLEKQLPLGPEGSLVLKFEAGKAVIELKHVHASGEISLVAKEDAAYFLDKLAAAIPGGIDDAIIAVIKAAILAAS